MIIGAVVALVLISGWGAHHAHMPAGAVETVGIHQHAAHGHMAGDCLDDRLGTERADMTACCVAMSDGCNGPVIDSIRLASAKMARTPGAFPIGAEATARGLRPEAEIPPPRA